jgi:hypothetical protein
MEQEQPQTGTVDIGPKNYKEAMGILEIVILDAERTGRQHAVEEVRKMATLADLLPEAIAIIQEARKLTSSAGTFSGDALDEDNGFVYSDPLTKRIEAFLRSIPKK